MTSKTSPTRAPGEKRSLPRSVSLTLLVWSALLRLCPRTFRQVYAGEMEQVFRVMLLDAWREDGLRGVARLWTPALGDVLLGAAAAHGDDIGLSIDALRRSWFMSRMRSSAITIFCAYIALVLTGMGFQKLTEDIMKTNIPSAYPGVGLAYDAIIAGAVLALLAVLVGGLPIAWDAIIQALGARRWGVLALFAVPPISLAIWLGWTWAILNVIAPAETGPHGVCAKRDWDWALMGGVTHPRRNRKRYRRLHCGKPQPDLNWTLPFRAERGDCRHLWHVRYDGGRRHLWIADIVCGAPILVGHSVTAPFW